jgi:hypothetical protein
MSVFIFQLLDCGLYHINSRYNVLVSCIDVEVFLLGSCFSCVNSLTVPLKLLVPDFFNDLGKGPYKLSDGQIVLEIEDLDIILSLCDR